MQRRKDRKIGRWIALVLLVCSLLAVIASVGYLLNKDKGTTVVEGYTPWSEEVVAAANKLPVQSGGRVKPFSTFANFELLRLHGARSIKFQNDEGESFKLSPTEWLLDALFRPQLSVHQPVFRVDNSEVLDAIGMEAGARRDRYSYADLEENGAVRLVELAKEAEDKRNRNEELDRVEQQILDLGTNYRRYEATFLYLVFARTGLELEDPQTGEETRLPLSTALKGAPALRGEIAKYGGDVNRYPARLKQVMSGLEQLANFSKYGLFIFPGGEGEDWKSAGNVIFETVTGQVDDETEAISNIVTLERLNAAAQTDQAKFAEQLEAFGTDLTNKAKLNGEATQVVREDSYNQKNYILNALVCFIIGFVLLGFMWLGGTSKVSRYLSWGVWAFSIIGIYYLSAGILVRGLVMGRFPLGNLFETIPFITACALVLAVFIEVFTKRRIFLSLVPIVGMIGLFLARRYELAEGVDTKDPLVAVLNSNFWLSTHVTTITFGYAAGLLTGFISIVYVLMRVLGLDEGDQKTRRLITRAAYGCVCFTLFLSLIGTVLGGIWANDSWGRFWGWDPKENGALMIVLWYLFILHARLGGYLKEWGIHLACIFGMAIITFSWWHVNILGVGLHSYGFAEDSKRSMVFLAYYIIIGIVAFGAFWSWWEKARDQRAENVGAAPVEN